MRCNGALHCMTYHSNFSTLTITLPSLHAPHGHSPSIRHKPHRARSSCIVRKWAMWFPVSPSISLAIRYTWLPSSLYIVALLRSASVRGRKGPCRGGRRQDNSRKDEQDVPLELVNIGDFAIPDSLSDLLCVHRLLDDVVVSRRVALSISVVRRAKNAGRTFLTGFWNTAPCW